MSRPVVSNEYFRLRYYRSPVAFVMVRLKNSAAMQLPEFVLIFGCCAQDKNEVNNENASQRIFQGSSLHCTCGASATLLFVCLLIPFAHRQIAIPVEVP